MIVKDLKKLLEQYDDNDIVSVTLYRDIVVYDNAPFIRTEQVMIRRVVTDSNGCTIQTDLPSWISFNSKE